MSGLFWNLYFELFLLSLLFYLTITFGFVSQTLFYTHTLYMLRIFTSDFFGVFQLTFFLSQILYIFTFDFFIMSADALHLNKKEALSERLFFVFLGNDQTYNLAHLEFLITR